MIKTGFFDSGIGGLFIMETVAKEVPGLSFYYISDDAFFPYGSKSESEIIQRSCFLTELLLKEGVNHIVVACNTATAIAIDLLRKKYPDVKFIGVEPYINIINKDTNVAHKTAVLVTPSTATSQRFKNLKKRLDPKEMVDVIPLKNLAFLAEEIYYKGETPDLLDGVLKELLPFKNQYSQVILGCTHYLRIENLIRGNLKANCISPATAIANRVRDLARPTSMKRENTFNFLSTKKNLWEVKPISD